MMLEGSTITLEAWDNDYKPNLDWNHAWGAAPGNIIPRYVLGLKPLTAGFGQVEIKPQLGQALAFAHGTIPTIRGPVFIHATNAAGGSRLLVNLPGNVAASVKLPTQGAANPVALVDGEVVSGTVSNGWLSVENIGSGQHAIWFSATNQPGASLLYSNWTAGWFGTNSGVPEIAAPAADPDGDGPDNYSEFIAGTDPTDPESRFEITSFELTPSPRNTVLTLAGVAGRRYTLQRTLNLAPAAWSNLSTNGVLATNQTLHLTDPAPPPAQAFYRAIVDRP
jgi:hypothetical protein